MGKVIFIDTSFFFPLWRMTATTAGRWSLEARNQRLPTADGHRRRRDHACPSPAVATTWRQVPPPLQEKVVRIH
jgi:hypothetical protein